MTRFTFKLESVRALREQAESQAREELARELARKADRDADLSAAQERFDTARRSDRLTEGSSTSAHELISLEAYVQRRKLEREQARAGLSAQEVEVGESRTRLEHAARDRAMLERLKERRQSEHRIATGRIEDAVLSEIALSIHRRAGDDAA
jgi:flagellar FliJ protein